MYKHYSTSVGNNLKTIQITTKYRYKMMQKNKIKVFCRVAIEEACKKTQDRNCDNKSFG
ncbi:MAG TPA: hypothetical protein VJH65_00850 [Candidatus Nanoarchaeia archaeon]|nr:hypothetical protein [Candidatus Nanoarchaeia archaeon]